MFFKGFLASCFSCFLGIWFQSMFWRSVAESVLKHVFWFIRCFFFSVSAGKLLRSIVFFIQIYFKPERKFLRVVFQSSWKQSFSVSKGNIFIEIFKRNWIVNACIWSLIVVKKNHSQSAIFTIANSKCMNANFQ